MRKLIPLVALIACDNPYDPDAPAIDPDAPRVHITTPARGTFAGDVAMLEVRGTALDDTGVASVTVNGVAAVVDSDGAWKASVPVAPGTNLLHAVATDPQGNTGKETRAVVAGKLASMDRMIPSGLTASLSAQTFDAVGRAAAGFVTTADLGALVAPMNPVVDINTENGQPDCAYAQAHIRGLSVRAASVDLAPEAGGLRMTVELDDVRVNVHAQWAILCADGSRDLVASADRLHVTGKLAITTGRNGFEISLQSPNVTIDNLDLDVGGIPQSIIDLLKLDQRLGPVLAWATERFVVPMVNDSLASLNEARSIEVLGRTIDIAVAPSRIDFTTAGALIAIDTELRAQGDSSSPGFVYVKNTAPAMDTSRGFQLAVADDAANQLFGSLWAAKGLELGLDLANGSYGQVGKLYDRVEIAAAVPPYLDATSGKLTITVGDLIASFKDGDSVATQVAINARLELSVVADPSGALRLDVGTPTTYVDVLDENIDGANQLSNAQFEAISTFALARVAQLGSGAIGAIPLPSVGGVALKDVSVDEQTGYVVVNGALE